MKKVALTGNMGSGKSYVSHCIKRYGVFVLDMDHVAKEIRKQYHKEIMMMFNVTNEKQLNAKVFNDKDKLVKLEQYLYPLMLKQMNDFFELHRSEKIVVIEVPLLFEKGWQKYFDEAWCVTCTQEIALQRLKDYRNISNEEAIKRLSLQMNGKEKEEKSNYLIYNNIGDDINKQLKTLLEMEEIYVTEG